LTFGWAERLWSAENDESKATRMKLYYSRNLNPRVAVAVARYLKSPIEFIRVHPRSPQERLTPEEMQRRLLAEGY
jgi:hypothetical protein